MSLILKAQAHGRKAIALCNDGKITLKQMYVMLAEADAMRDKDAERFTNQPLTPGA